MKRYYKYEQMSANYKEEAKNFTVEKLECLIKEVDSQIEDLLDRHECLEAKKEHISVLLMRRKSNKKIYVG